ncbi:MAG: hypothetical protein A3K06_02080 [Candidatus Doudnabacteria bacterium RIFCSPHIGHO2_01_52_17]|uniref:Uncharacterized protein n=1 Tax=Candidatus Doudnabacteria bacterium RIFCSPHIGHO2_01_52_17 TaxID=1817820 RepID=A0A1F5NFZ3_9BACT|nr:MAG: hypothetical protein A3K06_02080 [Candidatus Doudnabacteria bacterium RIFCSPHIGHO2_01_52_17]
MKVKVETPKTVFGCIVLALMYILGTYITFRFASGFEDPVFRFLGRFFGFIQLCRSLDPIVRLYTLLKHPGARCSETIVVKQGRDRESGVWMCWIDGPPMMVAHHEEPGKALAYLLIALGSPSDYRVVDADPNRPGES